MPITDAENNLLFALSFALYEESAKLLTVRVFCEAGKRLKVSTIADLTVEARKSGTSDAFVSLSGDGLDLSAWSGWQNFTIRFTAIGDAGNEFQFILEKR